ncbi:hypothetical protein ACIGHB_32520 [Streptomyces sp. NPDC085460]|uniref:hypothetical protein n=1 Tax=Streptomyces sp. NPDC085460 TaxID=3365723 RepID=UPI0037D86DA8
MAAVMVTGSVSVAFGFGSSAGLLAGAAAWDLASDDWPAFGLASAFSSLPEELTTLAVQETKNSPPRTKVAIFQPLRCFWGGGGPHCGGCWG